VGRRCIDWMYTATSRSRSLGERPSPRRGADRIGGEAIRMFADSLARDEVAIEATCYTHAIVRGLEPVVAR